jgi:hypothetical protein
VKRSASLTIITVVGWNQSINFFIVGYVKDWQEWKGKVIHEIDHEKEIF